MMRYIAVLVFVILTKAASFSAPFYCSDNDTVFADSALCNNVCSSSCQELNPSTSASSGACDTSKYRGFVYYNNKTYALTTYQDFWENFSNLVVVLDEDTNSLLTVLLSYYSVSSAWIGLYDPNRTQNFGVVDSSRFVWRDGSFVAYTNWGNGEPDNYVDQSDLGVVPILGEHWVEMDSSGKWSDTGYHASFGGSYAPSRYALVEWNGALDCVNGEPINAQIPDYQQSIIDNVCGGSTPCYFCVTADGSNVGQCEKGTGKDGQDIYSCPLDKALCGKTYTDPVCSSGGTFNPATNLCEASLSMRTPPNSQFLLTVNDYLTNFDFAIISNPILGTSVHYSRYGYNRIRSEVSDLWGGSSSSILSFYDLGSGTSCPYNGHIYREGNFVKYERHRCSNIYTLSKRYDKADIYRVRIDCQMESGFCSGGTCCWSQIYCKLPDGVIFDHLENVGGYSENNVSFHLCRDKYAGCLKGSGYIRVYYFGVYGGAICVNPVASVIVASVPSCPPGYVYDSGRNICTANPGCTEGTYDPSVQKCYVGDYTCPLGDYLCATLSDGKNYCSSLGCYDASDPSGFTVSDTVEGANDKKADGQIDQDGSCLGTIYIFNGNDYRCRPPGVETGFSDCCKKTTTWLGLGQCKPREKILAKLRTTNKGKEYTLADARCHYIGSYCALDKLGICLQRKKTFCCFGSVLARILHEQGRPQIGLSWGTPENPNCRGFTPSELQSIDFGKIDFSEYEDFMQDEVNDKFNPQDVQQNMQNKIQDFYNSNVK